MANITTTKDVGPGVEVYYDTQLRVRAQPYLIHSIAAQKRNLPQKSSSHIKFREYAALSLATVPLSEGVSPAGKRLKKTDILAEVKHYGDYVVISDEVEYIVEDQVLNETAQLLSQQMGETLDVLTRDVLESTASVYNCSGGNNGDDPTEITAADLDEVIKQLAVASGKTFTPVIEGSQNVGTSPVGAAYWCMGHTAVKNQLKAIPDYLETHKYSSQKPVVEAEDGAYSNCRFLLSPLGSVSEGASQKGEDVYNMFIAAQNGYGTIEMTDGTVENIFKDFGESGEDRLNQNASLGWKSWHAAAILNNSWVRKIRTTLA